MKDRLIPYMTGREMGSSGTPSPRSTPSSAVVLLFLLRWQLGDVVAACSCRGWWRHPAGTLIDGMRQIKTVGERAPPPSSTTLRSRMPGSTSRESRWMTNAEDLPAPANEGGQGVAQGRRRGAARSG